MSGIGPKKQVLIPLGLAAVGLSVFMYSRRRLNRDSSPRESNGTLLFKPDLAPHPGHYTWRESLGTLGKISPIKMLTDPKHWKLHLGIFRFIINPSYGTRIGAPAPDFDLPTVDGNRARLSDLRGKNVALMFSAET